MRREALLVAVIQCVSWSPVVYGQATSSSATARQSDLPPVTEQCQRDDDATAEAVDTLPSVIGSLLSPDAKRICDITRSDRGDRDELHVIQEGSLRGVHYYIWESNGSGGSIQGTPTALARNFLETENWDLTCGVDKVDDSPWCRLRKGSLRVGRSRAGYSVKVGRDNYPGSSIAIRIDDKPALVRSAEAGFQGADARRLVAQLRSGDSVLTRYQEWPYRTYKDEEHPLFGVAEALDLMERAFTSLRRPSRPKFAQRVELPDNVGASQTASAMSSPAPTVSHGQVYFEFQVDKPVSMTENGVRPKYPSVLESSGIQGEVQAQFVVDESGKAVMESVKILRSTNDLFAQAVLNALPRMQFVAAQVRGKSVSQVVQQSFEFAVPR